MILVGSLFGSGLWWMGLVATLVAGFTFSPLSWRIMPCTTVAAYETPPTTCGHTTENILSTTLQDGYAERATSWRGYSVLGAGLDSPFTLISTYKAEKYPPISLYRVSQKTYRARFLRPPPTLFA